VTVFVRRSWGPQRVLAPFLRVIALCVVVAIAVQSAQCPLDACDECRVGPVAAVHIAAAEAGACHNCICIGITFLERIRVLPSENVTFAAILPPNAVTEAHPGEPFLPPRSRA
jgi:hypothetical protein